jgi:hypothetical protein
LAASLAILPFYFQALDHSPEKLSHDLILPLMVHGGIWASCGLAAGVALGIGLGGGTTRILNAALGGAIGAALGAALYEGAGAALFQAARTTSPISWTSGTRLLARLLVAGLAGFIAGAVVSTPKRRTAIARSE